MADTKVHRVHPDESAIYYVLPLTTNPTFGIRFYYLLFMIKNAFFLKLFRFFERHQTKLLKKEKVPTIPPSQMVYYIVTQIVNGCDGTRMPPVQLITNQMIVIM